MDRRDIANGGAEGDAFRNRGGPRRLHRGLDHRTEQHGRQLDAQLAGDDARHVEHVFDELGLRPRVPLDDLERAGDPPRLDLAVAQHRRPAEDGVERGAQLVRQGREEFVLEAAGGLCLDARRAQRLERVPHLVLPVPGPERRADDADHRGDPDRPLDHGHVTERLDDAEAARRRRRVEAAREQDHRHIGPRRLRVEAGPQPRKRIVIERLLGQDDRAGVCRQLLADAVERLADDAANLGASEQLAGQLAVAADRGKDQDAALAVSGRVGRHPAAAVRRRRGIAARRS